jgi:hypothetical protein
MPEHSGTGSHELLELTAAFCCLLHVPISSLVAIDTSLCFVECTEVFVVLQTHCALHSRAMPCIGIRFCLTCCLCACVNILQPVGDADDLVAESRAFMHGVCSQKHLVDGMPCYHQYCLQQHSANSRAACLSHMAARPKLTTPMAALRCKWPHIAGDSRRLVSSPPWAPHWNLHFAPNRCLHLPVSTALWHCSSQSWYAGPPGDPAAGQRGSGPAQPEVAAPPGRRHAVTAGR